MGKPLIDPSHRGRFTKKAKKAGMSTQAFANRVLSPNSHANASTKKQANFARNFGGKKK